MEIKHKSTYKGVIKYYINPTRLANALGISKQAVHAWNGKIPRLRALELEQITDGYFQADKLSPPNRRRRGS